MSIKCDYRSGTSAFCSHPVHFRNDGSMTSMNSIVFSDGYYAALLQGWRPCKVANDLHKLKLPGRPSECDSETSIHLALFLKLASPAKQLPRPLGHLSFRAQRSSSKTNQSVPKVLHPLFVRLPICRRFAPVASLHRLRQRDRDL